MSCNALGKLPPKLEMYFDSCLFCTNYIHCYVSGSWYRRFCQFSPTCTHSNLTMKATIALIWTQRPAAENEAAADASICGRNEQKHLGSPCEVLEAPLMSSIEGVFPKTQQEAASRHVLLVM